MNVRLNTILLPIWQKRVSKTATPQLYLQIWHACAHARLSHLNRAAAWPDNQMGRAVPSDGSAARSKHGTQPVKHVVLGLVARQSDWSEVQIKFKCLYFLLNLVFLIEKYF
jgi:hypothetical protein